MASMAGESILKDFKPSGTEYPLAIRLAGKFEPHFQRQAGRKKEETSRTPTKARRETSRAED
jgi:hypothetical protein